MTDPTTSLGARIKQLRTASGMSQRELSERAEISIELIRKLEQGQRQTASITSLQAIARALDVDISQMLGKSTPLPDADPNSGVLAIRRVLTSVDDLIGPIADLGEPISLARTRRETTYAWGAYWGGRYDQLGMLLPQALVRARAVEASARVRDRGAAVDLLAQLYQITACTLVHLGHPDAAWLAAQQARTAADRSSDPLRIAALRGTISWLLLTQGRYAEGFRVAEQAAENLDPVGDVPVQQLSVRGALLLTAATSAGRDRRPDAAGDLLAEARNVAERIGVDRNDYELAFGISQVTMQTADVQVVTQQYGAALKTARTMPRDSGLPLAAAARHLADVAFSQTQLGMYEKATNTLLAMDSMAPDWMRYQTLPKQTITQLLQRERPTRLRELAARVGAVTS